MPASTLSSFPRAALIASLASAIVGFLALTVLSVPPARAQRASDASVSTPSTDVVYLPSLYVAEEQAAAAQPEPAQF